VLLFAYGSNMAAEEMASFAPEAHFVGPARLPGFRLEMRRRSIRWGGGAADIVESDGDEVWGAAYELADAGLLDAKEGAGFAYRRRELRVELQGLMQAALGYEVIDKEREEIPPTPEYAALLLRGARERGLPRSWLRQLENRLRIA
jgi:Gamma-glutamyl cyclotransferase, AIG2-like